MSRKFWLATWSIALLAWLAAPPAQAAKAVRVHAITGVRIVVAPGKIVPEGTVVMRDGLIEAAGSGVKAPADARLWDGKGLTVYAGLIDPYTVRATPELKDGDKAPQWANANALVRPERDILPWAGDAAAAKKLREAGYTTAAVSAKDGMFRGQGAVIDLGDGSAQDNLLRTGFAQTVTVKPLGGGRDNDEYPASLMGAVALFRQTLSDAAWYSKAKSAYAKNPRQERLSYNAALESLQSASTGSQLVLFETDDVLDALRDAHLAQEFKLKAALLGSGEEYKRLDDVKATGLAIVLPLDFPKGPKLNGDKDPNVEIEDLRHWDAAPENPKKLLAAGVDVSFTSYRLDDPKTILPNLATAIKRGLTADQALAGVTTSPARFLGLQDRIGTVEAGKLANLVVVDGDLFVEKPKIREVWVEGNRYEIKDSKPAEIEPAGTWELTVKTADGRDIPGVLELKGKADALTGKIAAMGKSAEVTATVSASNLEIGFEGAAFGQPGAFTMTLEINGDNATGSGSSPSGALTVTGSRTTKPSAGSTPPASSGVAQ